MTDQFGKSVTLRIVQPYRPEERQAWAVPDKVAPALCLDLDGTVRFSANGEFINKPEDVRLYPGVEKRILQYRQAGWLVFGLSNQGGVAHGFKTPISNDAELDAMLALFRQGNPFHLIKCCYHDKAGSVAPYNHRSLLRKPQIGMLALCEVEAFGAGYIVDWDNSLFVGDRKEDETCARNAGLKFEWAENWRAG